MEKPVINPNTLLVNEAANARHSEGLDASIAGDFTLARAAYAEAKTIITAGSRTIDSQVQLGRIVRDEGFVDAREARTTDEISLLESAKQLTVESFEILEAARNSEELNFAIPGGAAEKIKVIKAEQAATLGTLGRIATLQAVMTGAAAETSAYAESHERAVEGPNGYYRVSNAMNAARHERVVGRPRRLIRWLGRAAFGAAWTAANDRRNLKQAVQTAGGRGWNLRSKRAAAASVIKRP